MHNDFMPLLSLNASDFEQNYHTLNNDTKKQIMNLISQEINTNQLSLQLIPRENTSYRKAQFLLYYEKTQEPWLTLCYENIDLLADHALQQVNEQTEYLPYKKNFSNSSLSHQSIIIFNAIINNTKIAFEACTGSNTQFESSLCPTAQIIAMLLYTAKKQTIKLQRLHCKIKLIKLFQKKLHKTECKATSYAPHFSNIVSEILFAFHSHFKHKNSFLLTSKLKHKSISKKDAARYYLDKNLFQKILDREKTHEHTNS